MWKPVLIAAALVFMYSAVLWKLGYDWWTDDNYSHGLLVPFVIAYIVWQRAGRLRTALDGSATWTGWSMIGGAAILLLGGTLASVLFVQRLSLLIMIAGVVVSFFGTKVLRQLFMPFFLFLLAVPIPQLLFNKIAFPLQLLASRVAEVGISVLGLTAARKGNVIEIPYLGSGQIISLEVVEACSGIRSLMTLITLALILGYFTRESRDRYQNGLRGLLWDGDIQRTILLMAAAVPVALVTNAARVIITGIIAYYYGQDGVEGVWHDLSGSVVFVAALSVLLGLNLLLKRIFRRDADEISDDGVFRDPIFFAPTLSTQKTAAMFFVIVLCGAFVNWFQYRGELYVGRRPLREIPARLGTWEQRNDDIKFDPETEKVLRASDYVMRDYYGPGKRLNLYVGYYASQRTGATYHSPLSCLPGTGWEMTDPQLMNIETPGGKRFTVNRYIVNRGQHKEYLIYWYQGRGRTFASEYQDKLYTSLDSVTMRRSDGGMVRIMTPLGTDAERSLAAAIDLTTQVADNIGEFLPD
jgi:exosortase D (VPLPA-CTERM-specific)